MSTVIYKVFCKNCDASYVDQTKRLKTRFKEHMNNFKLNQSNSVITEHINNFNHTFDWGTIQGF